MAGQIGRALARTNYLKGAFDWIGEEIKRKKVAEAMQNFFTQDQRQIPSSIHGNQTALLDPLNRNSDLLRQDNSVRDNVPRHIPTIISEPAYRTYTYQRPKTLDEIQAQDWMALAEAESGSPASGLQRHYQIQQQKQASEDKKRYQDETLRLKEKAIDDNLKGRGLKLVKTVGSDGSIDYSVINLTTSEASDTGVDSPKPQEKAKPIDKLINSGQVGATWVGVFQRSDGSTYTRQIRDAEDATQKGMTAQTQAKVSAADALALNLNYYEGLLSKVPSGRVAGTVAKGAAAMSLDSDTHTALALQSALTGMIARTIMGEVGTMTDQDITRAEKALPKITDTLEERQKKFVALRTILAQRKQAMSTPMMSKQSQQQSVDKNTDDIFSPSKRGK